MDKTFALKLAEFKKALGTLGEALKMDDNVLQEDAVNMRFGYNFDLCWKTAKVFLLDKYGVSALSPKSCFRELRRNKLISDEATESGIIMVDHRNELVHNYDQEFAHELFRQVDKVYYGLMKKIAEMMEKDMK